MEKKPGAVTPGFQNLELGSQNAAGVDDGTTGAVHSTHTAAEAFAVINDGNIVLNMDCACGTDLLTHTAADAADFADAARILALVLVGALDNDVVGDFVDVD